MAGWLVLPGLLMIMFETIMKTGTQIKVDNHTQMVITCSDCAATSHVKAGVDMKSARDAMQRPCRACNPIHNHHCGQGWWTQFGLRRTQECITNGFTRSHLRLHILHLRLK